ncbi:acyl transferase domain-containing protein/acyl carrier protein [Catenulispora sp. EB89]|uniref:type I polyketide synthase n=1 Tax=Catenulispora sp. EB89 TaxID=3156257 RepID=UPI0035165D13
MADEEKLRQYLKKATGELQQTARRLREAELRDSEPIAVVGMGCVFPPGLRSAAELWRFVAGEGDGISPFPDDRGWSSGSGAGRGGFITGADLFDAEFFGIGDHEALAMDPQQRLLLETAWSALEDAGVDPVGLRGSQTGVYAGVSYSDYGAGPRDALPASVADQLIIGSSPSTASGRVSHTLGLRGPAISIDTACSSALVAIHLACQALRRGDCDLALAGGVTVMATSSVLDEFSRRGALAADGRCKPYASAADGMGFGEGAGLLTLERLSVAQRNGHSVLAVIRGTAINQDGATNGMTSPSRSAQEAVIRQALEAAGLTPDQVDAVEGHGTGTALGDSIEAEALIAVYGEKRDPARPLRLGSVKSNIGHTQTASGVAGVIKTVMSMRAGIHARTLHIDRPSGYVDWSDGTVVPTTESVPWPAEGRPRRAGVSSFGISGTNAHVILEEAAAAEADSAPGDAEGPVAGSAAGSATPWVLSAKTEPALRAMAAELGSFLATSPAGIAEVAVSLAHRSSFKHRAVILAASVDEHLAALAALARGDDAPGLHTGASASAKTAMVFVGCEPASAAECFPAMVQAYERLSACGVAPELVAGSGIGEIAAAHVAGILSYADALSLAASACAPDTLCATAQRIDYAKPRLTLVSTGGDPADPSYWASADFLRSDAEDVRSEVRARGAASVLELDPDITADQLVPRLATAFTAGTSVSWPAVFAGTGAGRIRLPGYPFQRRRFWLDAPTGRSRAGAGPDIVKESVHPLLGGPIDLAGSTERRFSQVLTAQEPWYAPTLPLAVVAEWALAAASHGGNTLTIEDLALGEPAALPLVLQTTVHSHGAIRGFSADADRGWTPVFTASATQADQPVPSATYLNGLRARLGEDEALALIEADTDQYLLNPVVLEACFRTALPLVEGGDSDRTWLPSSLSQLTRHRDLPHRLWCHARRTSEGPIDLELYSDSGEPLASITGLRHTAADPADLADLKPDDTASWDVGELSRLAIEEPQAARQTFTDILFTRVTTMVEGLDDDRENLRERFPELRLGDLGLDSLRAMRLREQLRAVLSVDVPPQRLLGEATVADVVDLVCRSLAARSLVVTGDEEPAAAGEIEELIL